MRKRSAQPFVSNKNGCSILKRPIWIPLRKVSLIVIFSVTTKLSVLYIYDETFSSFRTLDQDMSSLGMMLIFSINMVLPPCWYQYWNQSSLHSTNRLSDLIKISFPFFCVNNKGQSLHLERAQHKIQSDLSVDLQKKKFKLVKNKTCFYMSAKTYIQSEM